ncbi:MAG: hypothetical protein K1000chlam3_01688 [Chlamydiae bacterium]|nr:hypothetical protein [Chlamydiota bacterium]
MKDSSIKRYWLIILLVKLTLPIIIPTWAFSSLKSNPLLSTNKELLEEGAKILGGFSIFGTLIGIICSIIIFYCAYKKPGTVLLTITLISAIWYIPYEFYSLGTLQTSKLLLKNMNMFQFAPLLSIIQAYSFVTILIDLFWYYLCFNLRKINKNIQINQILGTPIYQTALQGMQAAINSQELETKYSEAVRNNPQISWYLKKIYKEKNNQTKKNLH